MKFFYNFAPLIHFNISKIPGAISLKTITKKLEIAIPYLLPVKVFKGAELALFPPSLKLKPTQTALPYIYSSRNHERAKLGKNFLDADRQDYLDEKRDHFKTSYGIPFSEQISELILSLKRLPHWV